MDWLADPRIFLRRMRSTPHGARAHVGAHIWHQGTSLFGDFSKHPRGLQLKVELELRLDAEKHQEAGWNQRPHIQETLYFCQGFQHGLLGQSAFFENFGVVFLHFPTAPEGRRFGLFAPPLGPPNP